MEREVSDELPVHLSKHARDTMQRRGVLFAEILRAVHEPEVTYTSDGCVVHQRHALAVVVAPNLTAAGITESLLVVTVLLRSQDQWDDDQARRRTRS